MKVLLLGGTAKARALASELVAGGHQVISSLAGRTKDALRPAGELRSGGFGGVAGLAEYLHQNAIDAVINATHPFAAQMSRNAVQACTQTNTPLLRLDRESWAQHPLANTWHWVNDHQAAAKLAKQLGGTVWLTVGRQNSGEYADLTEQQVLCRVAMAPNFELPQSWQLLESIGPFDYPNERRLLSCNRINVLITKDSGGDETAAKLQAAADMNVAVIMIRRPPVEPGQDVVTTIEDALAWVQKVSDGS